MDQASLTAQSKPQKLWIYPLAVVAVTVLGFPIAARFYTPSGPQARVLLPGVIIAVVMALVACILFMRCPRRPLWLKMLTLILSVPSLLFAVNCVMEHVALSP